MNFAMNEKEMGTYNKRNKGKIKIINEKEK